MSGSTGGAIDFVRIMPAVARELLGQPNEHLSTKDELRFGSRGSMAINLKKGTWCDHSDGDAGGGVMEFLKVQKGLDKPDAMAWLEEKKLIPASDFKSKSGGRIIAVYDYLDAAGDLLFQVVRKEPKTFLQRRPDGAGGWIWRTADMELVLYRLPDVLKAVAAGRPVYIVEGEKAVDALAKLDVTATCSPRGAGKWKSHYSPALAGADVLLLPDNDDEGRKHVAKVGKALHGIASSVRVLTLPGLAVKGDVADWIAAGGTAGELAQIAADAPAFEAKAAPETAQPAAAEETPRARGQDGAAPGTIRVIAGELHTAATAAEAAIIAAGGDVYQRGATLVRPIAMEVTASRGRTTISAALGEVGVPGMVDVLSGCARWEKFDGRSESWRRIDPPVPMVQVLLSRHGQWAVPAIAGVITTPTIRPDGTLLIESGYDAATRLFYVADPGLKIHPGVHNPTRALAEKALAALKELLAEFPFTNEVSRAVALSAILTPVVRGALSVAPLQLCPSHPCICSAPTLPGAARATWWTL